MKPIVLAFLAAGILTAADNPRVDPLKKEKEKLQGLWGVASAGVGRIPNPKDGVPVFEVTVERFDFYLLEKKGGRIVKKAGSERLGTYRLDPAKKPKHIDVTFRAGPDKGKTLRGIYVLKGDDLKVAFSFPPGKARPTKFSSDGEEGVEVLFLKRTKPK